MGPSNVIAPDWIGKVALPPQHLLMSLHPANSSVIVSGLTVRANGMLGT